MLPEFKYIQTQVAKALTEDLGAGDVSAGLLPAEQRVSAEILSREPMLLCGQAWVEQSFVQLDPSIELNWRENEGTWIDAPAVLLDIQGPARALLTGERVALNFLQTLSATAGQTRRFVQVLEGTGCQLLDTRKTIPGWRMAQKYAVRCGGGVNHRMGLYDAFLIKENHIIACGGVAKAIEMARRQAPALFLEIEVESMAQLAEALPLKPDRIMLDNFSIENMVLAVEMNVQFQCSLEASGGITLDNARTIARTGVDYISVGSVTKDITSIDLSMRIQEV